MIGLGDLECHFNWEPERNSTKEDLEELILRTENKCWKYPEGITAYRCIIGYLHAIPGPVDYTKSFDVFNQLLDFANPFGILDDFRCDFIVRANKLVLEVQKLRRKNIDSEEVKQEIEDLSKLWQQPQVQMGVYLIKGITFLCFGSTKRDLSCKAFQLALELTETVECSNHQLFIIIWGLAFAKAKMMRQESRDELTEEEMSLWERAFQILEENETLKVNEALFFTQYAYALPNDHDEKKAMVKKAFDIIQNCDEQSILSMPIMKCIMLAKRTKQIILRDALIEKALKHPRYQFDGNFIYEMSLGYSYKDPLENDKAIGILNSAKEKAVTNKKHIFLDLALINRQRRIKGKNWAETEFATLLVKYADARNRAIICTFRAQHYFYCDVLCGKSSQSEILASLDNVFHDLVDAHESLSNSFLRPAFSHNLYNFLEERKLRPEFLGWFLENVRGKHAYMSPTRIQTPYKSVIEDTEATSNRKEFALVHLGKHYLKNEKLDDAKRIIVQLSSSCPEKKYMLSESVYRNGNSSLDDLIECMKLGNCDVIKLVLDKLEESKSCQLLRTESFLNENFFADNDMFFSTSCYELCSSILDLLECEEAFCIDRGKPGQDFVTSVKTRIENILGISHDKDLWRLSRLEAVRLNQSNGGKDEHHHKMNREIRGLLTESRKELDRSVKKLGPKKRQFFYPRVIKGDFLETEDQMKETLGIKIEEVETRIKKDLKECRISSSSDLVSFLVNREHYIITQEAAWQVLWMNAINEDKHESQLDLAKLEENVLTAQKQANVNPGINCVLDIAHKVAEYVEQTRLVFNTVQSSTSSQTE